MFVIYPSKKKRGLCTAYRCKNKHTPKDRFCAKHRHRYNREVHPLRYYYNLLKSNARARGKHFSLSLEEFGKFCEETGYLEKKGKSASSASIDRKDATKGYTYDNIQMLTIAENSAKRWQDHDPNADNYCPF